MKTTMLSDEGRAAFEANLLDARRAMSVGDTSTAWPLLERAHILSQPEPGLHIRSHWWMLRCAIQGGDVREVVGQAIRVALAGPSSFFGRYPRGNTGRARVGLFTPMQVEPDVQVLLAESEV